MRLVREAGKNKTFAFTKEEWLLIGEKTGWLNAEAKKKGKKVNPWAVCHTTVDKDKDPEKYERCVMDVKKKHPIKKD